MTENKKPAETKREARRKALEEVEAIIEAPTDSDAHGGRESYIEADASKIVENIESGIWTATNVLKAYIAQTIVAQRATNCITEVLFKEALEEAKQLDAEFKKTNKIKGPLHGVPVSAKDLYRIANFDATIGYTKWIDNKNEETAELIELVRNAGGIIFVKTNVPQTMLSFECNNPLWGRTLNPHTLDTSSIAPQSDEEKEQMRKFTCGGSSGGEAALLACDGSALGLGSDIGGSLRIPTAFCGTYALKPSPGRMSHKGTVSPQDGFVSIPVCQGPMGRSVRDIELACQVLLGKGRCKLPIPYRQEEADGIMHKSSLKFGYYLSDGVVKASPACQRAVLETIDALRFQGHECVLVTPPDVKEALGIFVGLTSQEKYDTLKSHLGGDPQDPSLRLVTLGPQLPSVIRKTAAWTVECLGDEIFAHSLRNSREKTAKEVMQLNYKKEMYMEDFEKKVWIANGIDGIICPVLASPALPHGATKYLSPLAIGTFLYNVVDSSVGVVPVTHVDPLKDILTDEWLDGSELRSRRKSTSAETKPKPPQSESNPTSLYPYDKSGPHGSRMIEERLYNGDHPIYDAKAMAGLPIGVQIVGRCFEDEKVVEMMKIVDNALKTARREPSFGPGSSRRYFKDNETPTPLLTPSPSSESPSPRKVLRALQRLCV